jgi:hypothetical protein
MIGIHKNDFVKAKEYLSQDDKAEPLIVDLTTRKVSLIAHK